MRGTPIRHGHLHHLSLGRYGLDLRGSGARGICLQIPPIVSYMRRSPICERGQCRIRSMGRRNFSRLAGGHLNNRLSSSILTIAALAATLLVTLPVLAQEQEAPRAGGGGGAEGRGPRRPSRPATPTPRLADGHPDLGNGAGSWSPIVVPNIAGSDPGGARQSKLVEKPVDVPFLPAAKAIYDERNAVLSKNDPESRCLPPGVPRMMATPFPFPDLSGGRPDHFHL